MGQVLLKKMSVQQFLENGLGFSRSGWVGQGIPPAEQTRKMPEKEIVCLFAMAPQFNKLVG